MELPVFDPQTVVYFQMILTTILLPFVISLLKNPKWSRNTKQVFAIGFSILATLGIFLFNNQLNISDLVMTIMIVTLAVQGFYTKWFSDLKLFDIKVDEALSNLSTPLKEDLDEPKNSVESDKTTQKLNESIQSTESDLEH